MKIPWGAYASPRVLFGVSPNSVPGERLRSCRIGTGALPGNILQFTRFLEGSCSTIFGTRVRAEHLARVEPCGRS